jgi:hypothetical protein
MPVPMLLDKMLGKEGGRLMIILIIFVIDFNRETAMPEK